MGTIGLARIGGPLGWLISVGQALAGDWSYWTHVFVVVDDIHVIQAMPGGARLASLAYYLRPGAAKFLYGWPALSDTQQKDLATQARTLIGVGYGYTDYLSIAALAFGMRPKWLRRRVAGSGRLICSQLADELFSRIGVQLFDDGRVPMDVTPGDIDIRWGNALSERLLDQGESSRTGDSTVPTQASRQTSRRSVIR